MRVVERLWGSRRFASFLILSFCFTSIISPVLLILLRPLSLYVINYLPAGPTALIFAILAQYHAVIPHQYKYKVAATSAPMTEENFVGVTFSDKSYIYLPAIQLGLSQFPGSLISAMVGWIIGYCWRNDVLPTALTRWRLPGWMVGVQAKKRSEGFEGMRRRLEGENTAAATGSDVVVRSSDSGVPVAPDTWTDDQCWRTIATLSGVGIINLGVNGVLFQAPSSKVTNDIIPKTLSTSSNEEYIKTFELGTLATSSSTDVTSACRIGSNLFLQSDNSGRKFEVSRPLGQLFLG
ncbi:hypothetical protein ACHAPC_006482 [Botrytis cinerea]